MKNEKKKFRLRVLRIPAIVLAILLIIAAVTRLSSPKQEKQAKKQQTAAKEPAAVSVETDPAADPAPDAPAPVPQTPAPEEKPASSDAPEDEQAQVPTEPDEPTEAAPGTASETQQPEEIAEPVAKTIDPDKGLPLEKGLNLLGLNSFSGVYLEDASDDTVDDIMAATIRNDGTEAIEYATVTLSSASGESYSFSLTILLPGQTVIVLDDYRTAFDADFTIAATSVYNVVMFDEIPTMHEQELEIIPADQTMTIRNISSGDFPGGRVYYKTTSNDMLLGGITYLAVIPALGPGKEITINASHCFPGISRLQAVVYS